MSPLQPFVEVVHFVRNVLYYFFGISYHIGRIIIIFLTNIYLFLKDIILAIVIIAEELYRFVCQLNQTLSEISDYIGNTTNAGINCVLDAGLLFCQHIKNFFSTTQVHSRLLATSIGNFVVKFFTLLHDALTLIGDIFWWIITLIPRLLLQLVVETGDLLVWTITGTGHLILNGLRTMLDNIFRVTIAVALIFVICKKRREIFSLFILLCRKLTMWLRHLRLILASSLSISQYRRNTDVQYQTPQRTVIRTRLRGREASPFDRASLEHQHCVVCRDQIRSVLLLPCKHLCLCEHCADIMLERTINPFCPLCRTEIEQSMSVYI